MRRIYFLFFILLSGWAFAGSVPEEQALRMAVAFWQSAPQTRGTSSATFQMVLQSENLMTRSTGVEPAYYVFDNTSGPGFVIVSGDDAAMPVLAYSFENEFPTEDMPANLKGWLQGIRDEINYARQQGMEASGFVTKAWTATSVGTPIVELETALWDQSTPYNAMCPKVNRLSSYTGCTATALAIVMKFHEWPEQGVGTLPAYTTDSYKVLVESLPLGHTYDWENMKLEYLRGQYNQTEADAVATLMRDCAVGIKSDFGPLGSSGTGAYSTDIPPFLIDHMGYDRGCRIVYRANYNTMDWNLLLEGELDNERPVLLCGYTTDAGHAFVLDGYDTNHYFSVNWGWGGMSNGYFLLSALDPYEQGAGGSDSGYNLWQNAVIGAQPDKGGDYVEELSLQNYEDPQEGIYANGIKIVEGSPVQNETFDFEFGFLYNSGNINFTGDVLVAMTDKEGVIQESLGVLLLEDLPVGMGYAVISGSATIQTPIHPGYRIRIFYRTAKKLDWTLIRANDEEGCVWDLVIADETTIEETTSMSYSKVDRMIRLQVKEGVAATLMASDGTDFSSCCKLEDNAIVINTSGMGSGRYVLTLTKGADTKTVTFVLPETNLISK